MENVQTGSMPAITIGDYSVLHEVFTGIVEKELRCTPLVPDAIFRAIATDDPGRPVPDEALPWLALLDLAVNPHLLRKYVKQQSPDESVISVLLRYLTTQANPTESHRDKVDWLATYLFQSREERLGKPCGWPKAALLDILHITDPQPLQGQAPLLLNEMADLLDEIKYLGKFIQITESGVVQRGRNLKRKFGPDFFHPDVLAAVVNYNLVFGKVFHRLLKDAMDKARSFARAEDIAAPGGDDLLQADYQSTAEAFRGIGEIGGNSGDKTDSKAGAKAGLKVPDAVREEQLKDLGVNVAAETFKLKQRVTEITTRFMNNPSLQDLKCERGTLHLREWESAALRANFPSTEQSFRADCARELAVSIAIISLVEDELPSFLEAKAKNLPWKKHSDTLLFLLQDGRWHKERLVFLASSADTKGAKDKARQLFETVSTLETILARIAAVY